MARKRQESCAWCSKAPLDRLEIALSKKLLPYSPPPLLCMACLEEELKYDEAELRYLAKKFREEGCSLFQ